MFVMVRFPHWELKGFRRSGKKTSHLEEDFIGKGKIGYSGYWTMTRDSDRIWFRERDGIAKWSSISTLFMTRSYEFPGTGSKLQVWRILDLTCVPHMLIGIEHVFVYYDCWFFYSSCVLGLLVFVYEGRKTN
ncbi:hypothetical protein Bca4012_077087 [Brassica carinata]